MWDSYHFSVDPERPGPYTPSMPRVARIVIPGLPHHITQRGNNRQDVFFVDDDRQVYLGLLARHAARFGLQVLGYCLMPNHVHLVAVPETAEALARAVGRTHLDYARYVNRLHGRSGHLWQNRFFSCPLDAAHLWTALAYVDTNPVRAGLAPRAWAYPWSSAAAHVGAADPWGLLDEAAWKKRAAAADYRSMLGRPADEAAVKRLRSSTLTGRPLGTDAFLAKLEHALGRRLRASPLGRPKGSKKKGK